MKLEIELFRYREVLFGRVLHMEEYLRVNLSVENDDFAIKSVGSPDLTLDTLYVRGSSKAHDERAFSFRFDSEEEAIKTAKNIQNLVREINGPAQDDILSSVERLI